MTDAYAWWRAVLDGVEQPIHENEPHVGFYYRRQKNGPRLPVAIWMDGGTMVALVGFDERARAVEPGEVWTWCCRYPVTEETYRGAFFSGQWPDDPPPVPAATSDGKARPNASDDPAEQLREELAGELELAETFLAAPVATQAEADKAGVWAKRLTELKGRAVDGHKVEKAPILEQGRAIDTKWFTIRDVADELAKRLKAHVEPFLKAKKRAAEAAAAAAAEEAARLRREADEAGQRSRADAAELEARAAEAQRRADAKPAASVGRTGAQGALRTVYVAVITDYDAAYAALREHPDMKAFVQTLADRACRAKVALAGVEFRPEEKAA